jgi:hypothetical protein
VSCAPPWTRRSPRARAAFDFAEDAVAGDRPPASLRGD